MLCQHLQQMHTSKPHDFGKVNQQVGFYYDNWVKRNFGMYRLHPHHSMNCTAGVVLHLLALPPFPGQVILVDAVQTIGARVEALQAHHIDLCRCVYAFPDMIQRTFVTLVLDNVPRNVLSLRWHPMMLSQLTCGSDSKKQPLVHPWTEHWVQQFFSIVSRGKSFDFGETVYPWASCAHLQQTSTL